MSIKSVVAKYGLEKMINNVYENPEKGMQTLLGWADKFAKGEYESQRKLIREIVETENHPYHDFVFNIFRNLDKEVVKKLLVNFFVYANLAGQPLLEENRKKYNCNIPWAILLDPTSACNLHCTG